MASAGQEVLGPTLMPGRPWVTPAGDGTVCNHTSGRWVQIDISLPLFECFEGALGLIMICLDGEDLEEV